MRAFADRLGDNIRRARERAGLSQEETSFRAGLHRTAVGQLERGERVARADTLVKLAAALEVPVGEFFEGLTWQPGYVEAGRFLAIDSGESKASDSGLETP